MTSSESESNLGRNTAVMAAGTLVSRVLGLVRTMLLVAAIGVTGSVAAESFSVANKLPNVMFAVLAAGVLNSVLVPQIVRAFREGRDHTVHRILTIGIVGITVATVVLTITASFWVRVYSDGWTSQQIALATAFALWCIPQLLFYGLYTLFGQVLNAREQFGWFMWAPVLANVVAIAGLCAYLVLFGSYAVDKHASVDAIVDSWTPLGIALIGGGATLGIAAQALVLIIPMRRGGYRWSWVWRGPKGELSTVSTVASWALGAVAVEQVGVAWVTNVATAATHAAKTDPAIAGQPAYDFALGIMLVPHSLVSISLMTAVFVHMSKFAAAGDTDRLRSSLSEAVRMVGVFTIFAAATLAVTAPLVTRTLTPPGTSAASVESVAMVLRIMAFALVPLGASVMLKQAFFALEDSRTVFWIHIPMTVAFVGVALIIKHTCDPQWWVPGVALGLVATNLVAAVLRLWGLNRPLGGVDLRRILTTHGKALVAVVPAVGVGMGLSWILPESWRHTGWVALGASAALTVLIAGIMAVVFLGLARLVRLDEATGVVRAVSRKFVRVR